jgi:nucleoprotein TPR
MEALEGRLARVDAHADELTTSNERLRGELTAANATVARMTIDVSHYTGKCERFEASLEAVKGERDSESRGRNQLEELNNKLQTHLEAARSELARKQQQFETVSVICFCLLVIAVHSE